MSEVKVDTISERTAAGGVTIDGVLVKDGTATFQTAAGSPLVFEGATADAFETTFAITDPTADRTITFPDSSFTVPTGGGLFSGYAVFQDQKTVGTDGGTFTSGAWRTRVLNATVFNTDTTNISLGTDQFTLLTGSYLIEWSAPAYEVNSHQARLFDVTGGSWFQNGTSEYAHETTPISTRSFGSVRVTVAASPGTNIYSVEHRAETTKATLGFGLENNFSAGPEVYTTVIIYKES